MHEVRAKQMLFNESEAMKIRTKVRFAVVLSQILCSAALVSGAPPGSTNQNSKPSSEKKSTATPAESDVARGRYLVEEVAKCPECHTPRDESGLLDHSRWLQGGPIWFMPAQSKTRWAMQAPALAGFPYTDQQGQDILERGIGTNGNPIQPPMHIYHLNHADAVAVIAYLRSVPRSANHP